MTLTVVLALLVLSAASLCLHQLPGFHSRAATITVTNINDSGAGSLRQAIANAMSGDTITFAANVSGTITLTSGGLVINKNLTIQGPGANGLSVNGNANDRVIGIDPAITATISGLRITGGRPGGINNNQGILTLTTCTVDGNNGSQTGTARAAAVINTGTLEVTNCTISGNDGGGNMQSNPGQGGGINNSGALKVINSTISNNFVVGDGGGIYNTGSLQVTNSTIIANQIFLFAPHTGGGIFAGGTETLNNTIVAGNSFQGSITKNDIDGGTINSASNNLIGDAGSAGGITNGANGNIVGVSVNSVLNTILLNNGGTTATHALILGSPAINAGNNVLAVDANNLALSTDQRGTGFPRIVSATVDIGAFEGNGCGINQIVTNTNDSGAGSLRQAIADACPGTAINFNGSFATPKTITLVSGALIINKDLNIQGSGADKLSVSGNNASTSFQITSGNVTISGVRVTSGGHSAVLNSGGTLTLQSCAVDGNQTSGDDGGGINNSSGMVTVLNSTISNNRISIAAGKSTTFGGGIFNAGTMNLTNCTIANNINNGGATFGAGGGIYNNGTLNVTNCTISNNSSNSSAAGGGGIANASGLVTGTFNVRNTIVAGNTNTGATTPDAFGPFTSQGNNLIGKSDGSSGFTNGTNGDLVGSSAAPVDPRLLPLGDYGGTTQTLALSFSSPAVNAANNGAPPQDQRGVGRNGPPDIGSFEASINFTPATLPTVFEGAAYSQTVIVSGAPSPFTFVIQSGTLPSGLSLAGSATSFTISGATAQLGSFPIVVKATGANGTEGFCQYPLTVVQITWTGSVNTNWHTAGNWNSNAVPANNVNITIPSGTIANEPSITTTDVTVGSLTIQSGRTLTVGSGRTLTLSTLSQQGTLAGTGTVTCTNGGSVSGAISVTNFSLSGGTLSSGSNFSANNLTINSGGTLGLSHVLSLTGNLTVNGAYNAVTANAEIACTGASAQTLGGSNLNLNKLTINNPASVNLNANASLTDTLALTNGDLNTGGFTLTLPDTAVCTGTGDVVGNTTRIGTDNVLDQAFSFGNPNLTVKFDLSTQAAPSSVTMNLVKSAPASFTNAITRTYTISTTGGVNLVATLRFNYKDTELNGNTESGLQLWKQTGASTWSKFTRTAFNATANWVERGGVSLPSPINAPGANTPLVANAPVTWTLSSAGGPTAVEFNGCNATAFDNGTLIEWQTGFEADNLGFNLYRDEAGKRALVNREIVAGSALTAGSTLGAGASYAWWDDAPAKSATYWLEDLDLNGGSTWHGPFYARFIGGKPAAQSRAATLSQRRASLSQVDSSRPIEVVAAIARPTIERLNAQSAIAAARAVKIAVRSEGWYRVTQPELVRAGLDPRVDPRLLQLFVDGRQQPIIVSTGKGNSFDESSAMEFYGVGLDTPATDARTYWLVAGAEAGLRVEQVKGEGAPAVAQSFTSKVERRDRSVYFAALRNGERENFFGAVIAGSPVDLALTLKHVAQVSAEPAEIEVALQGVTGLWHRVQIQLNGASVYEMSFNGQEQGVARFSVPHSRLGEGANTVRLIAQNGASDVSLVDRIGISYQHAFIADADALKLTAAGGQAVTIGGFSSRRVRVFDVTDSPAVEELIGEIKEQKDGYSVTVAPPATGERLLLAVAAGQMKQPESSSANHPSTWRDAKNAADLLIITRRDFFTALEPLQNLRQSEGYKVALVEIEDIYDEFNFGNKSPQAVKDFLRFAKTSWKRAPRFVLMAGDASYDARNYLGFGDHDLVPTKLIDTAFMETASDDWLADFNEDGLAEMAVGRLPVRRAEEASLMVAKITAYERSRPSEEVLLVADANDGYDFEGASSALRALVPANLRVNQLNRGRLDAATAKARLLEAIKQGQKVINYVGHGNVNQWRGNLLTADEARALTNADRLPLFVMMTCLNGYFQDAALDSLAESLLKAEGGAVAVWASTGMTFPDEQAVVNQQLFHLLFGESGKGLRLGEAVQRAKTVITGGDVRRTWVLLGDPTQRLP